MKDVRENGQFQRNDKHHNDGPRINEQIRIRECRLIDEHGELIGVVSIDEARRIAFEREMDLVEVSPNAKPPVVKVIDYGKYKYNAQKKASDAKKKQLVIQIKEVQFKPNIEAHDLETKLNHIKRFLSQGDKVKMVMQFRGREMAYKDAGMEKFLGMVNVALEAGAVIEAEAKFMGNRIIAIVAPDKKILKVVAEKIKEKVKEKQS